jgi:hypothetical protein
VLTELGQATLGYTLTVVVKGMLLVYDSSTLTLLGIEVFRHLLAEVDFSGTFHICLVVVPICKIL